jgi:pimeloyl-ACP methyl ester carboxylesterase
MMTTHFASSPDGTRVAYDVSGSGPAIVLLHGAGYTRQHWHDAGYVERLKSEFTVITVDLRGNGESDRPTDPASYTTGKLGQDILAVADDYGVDRFTVWGFSYGGNIARYLAAQSDCIAKLIIIGIPFGLGATGEFRQFIEEYRDFWTPILQAQAGGTLDLDSLSEKDREEFQTTNVPLNLAWLSAMLEWKAVEPTDLRCPTLWLSGSKNEAAMASIKEYAAKVKGTQVQVEIVESLNHPQEFSEIDKVLPVMLSFTKKASRS